MEIKVEAQETTCTLLPGAPTPVRHKQLLPGKMVRDGGGRRLSQVSGLTGLGRVRAQES